MNKNGEVGLIFLGIVAVVVLLLAFGLIHFKMNATSPYGTNSTVSTGPSNPNVALKPGAENFDIYLENKLGRDIYPNEYVEENGAPFEPKTDVTVNVAGSNNTILGENTDYTIPLFGVVGMQAGV